MKQLTNRNSMYGDESRLAQTRYWQSIGGSGISPEMLVLTGFWSESVLDRLKESNVDPSQTVNQLYGGVIRFQPLPGKKWEARFDKIIDALNTILQIRRHIDSVIETIQKVLNEKWHQDDSDFLPKDLPDEKKRMIMRPMSFSIADDPYTARQLMSLIPILKSLKNNPQYYSGIYREANTIFGRMVLESVSLSLRNLSMKDSEPHTVTLEELADHAAEVIVEG